MNKKILLLLLLINLNSFSQNLKLHITIQDSTAHDFKTINYKKLHQNAKSISREITIYREKLQQLGFLNHQISKTSQQENQFNYLIQLNLQIKTLTIAIPPEQNTIIRKINPQLNIKNQKLTIPFEQSQRFLNTLTQNFKDKGYSFIQLALKNIRLKNNIAYARLTINTDKVRKIDQIIIKGYPKFPKTFIKYRLQLPSTKPLNEKQLKTIDQKINKLTFTSSIKPSELLFEEDKTTLYLYIKQKQASSFQGTLGINSSENKKTALYGYLKLHLINIFNKGESTTINWNKTDKLSQSLKVSNTLPYLFKSPISGKIALNIKKIDSSYTNTAIKLSLFLEKQASRIGVGGEKLYAKTPNNPLLANFTKNSIFAYYTFKKASTINLFLYKTYHNIQITRGLLKSDNTDFYENKIEAIFSKRFKLNPKNYLYINSNNSYTESTFAGANNDILLGGANTLQGFNENSFKLSGYSILTLSQQHVLSNSIYSSLSMQVAYLENKHQYFYTNTLSFGGSLNLKQQNGLLTVGYYLGKTANNSFNLANSKITISFLTFF